MLDKVKEIIKKIDIDGIRNFFVKNKRYIGAAGVFVLMICILAVGTDGSASSKNPMAGAYQSYEENEDQKLLDLITNYYNAYAAGDVETLQKYATPVSASEQSYIQNYSQFIEKYQNIKLYTKRGIDENAYLVSAYLQIKFNDIDTPVAGLDFFYVETHSSSKTDHKELIDMINTGIKGVVEKRNIKKKIKEEECIQIKSKLKATEGNTVFVNFYKTSKSDVYGINEYFDTIADHIEASKVYQSFQVGCYADEESFKEKIKEEAEIRRLKAKDVLFKHRIGGGLIGMVPAVDWALQKYVVQKDAAKKAGAIFGFDITICEKQQEIQIQSMGEEKLNDKKMNTLLEEPQITITKNNNNDDGGDVNNDDKNKEENKIVSNKIKKNKKSNKDKNNEKTILGNKENIDEDNLNLDKTNNNDIENENDEGKDKNKTDNRMKYGRFALSAFTGSVSFTTNAANLLVTSASVALTAATITFSFIGSVVGFGMGQYLAQRCRSARNKARKPRQRP